MAQVQNISRGTGGETTLNQNTLSELTAEDACPLRSQREAGSVTSIRIAGLDGHNPRQNKLLAALPLADFRSIAEQLEFIAMPCHMVVCEADAGMKHVYFPTSCIVSLMFEARDGASVETAMIGFDGIVGVGMFMGGGASRQRAVVKCAGYGFRLPVNHLTAEFARGGAFQKALLGYAQALMTQMAQISVCNRHHNVTQQLCRLLLQTLDRLPSSEICLTQEAIAAMLGVRRESIACAAGILQVAGVIHYARGHIKVLNRPALESRSCECYGCATKEYGQSHAEQAAR